MNKDGVGKLIDSGQNLPTEEAERTVFDVLGRVFTKKRDVNAVSGGNGCSGARNAFGPSGKSGEADNGMLKKGKEAPRKRAGAVRYDRWGSHSLL